MKRKYKGYLVEVKGDDMSEYLMHLVDEGYFPVQIAEAIQIHHQRILSRSVQAGKIETANRLLDNPLKRETVVPF